MARILGIDLGSHSVKVAVLEGSLGRFELDDYHMRLVAQDLDAPPTLDARLAALDALLEDLGGAGGALTSAGFPTEHASVRLIRLPFGDKNKVEQALPFEVENQVPFDLDEMILAPRVIQLEQGDSQVLAAMAPTSTVSNTIDVLAERGADPKVLPVDADVLGRYADDGVQAIIDVGHSRTLMTLCRGGRVLGCRAISSGGAELTRSLAERHGLTWGEAEGHKHVTSVHPLPPKPPDPHEATSIRRRRSPVELEALAAETSAFPAPFRGGEDPTEPPRPAEDSALVRPPAPVQAEWEEETPTAGKAEQPAAEPPRTLRPPLPADPVRMGHTLREALLPLLADIRTSLIAFEDAYEVEVDEVLLAGGTAYLSGLSELLVELLGVPVRSMRVSETAQDRGEPGRFALCHGLGRAIAGNKKTTLLDLRRDELAFRGDLATLGNIAKYAAVAAVLLMFVGMAAFVMRVVQLNQQAADLDEQIAAAVLETFPDIEPERLEDTTMALAIMQERTLETTLRVDTLGTLVSDEPPTLDTLRAVSDAMPNPATARVDVREILFTSSAITMKAQTDGFEEVGKIERSLQADSRFKQATRGDESKTKSGDVKFTVTIPLGELESEEG